MAQDEYYYNEHDESQVKKILKSKKKKKVKKLFKVLFVLMVLGIVVFYFMSDFSKVQSIRIVGNEEVPDENILDNISVSDKSIFLFVQSSQLEKEIKDIPLIKKANVSKDFLGNIRIEIQEAEKVAYCVIGDVSYVIDELGNVSETEDQKIIDSLQSCPKLTKFKDLDLLKSFAKEYVKIPELIKNQTSDIVYDPLKVDTTRLKFIMVNGKLLYVRIEEMADVLSSERFDYEANMTKYTDVCEFRFEGKHIYTKSCD